MTKNFWKGTRRKEASKFTLFIFRSFQKKKKEKRNFVEKGGVEKKA